MRTIKYEDSLEYCYPEIAKEWHPIKNGDLKPTDISANSVKKVWWFLKYYDNDLKKVFEFEWKTRVDNRVSRGQECPYLTTNKYLKGFNDLETRFPNLVKEWHPTKNGNLRPSDFHMFDKRKVWWLLSYYDDKTNKTFEFEWETKVENRTRNGTNCPYLTGNAVKVGFNDLYTTHPDIAKEWHPIKNGNLTPYDVSAASTKKVWWLLHYYDEVRDKYFDFEWEAVIGNRTTLNAGCPYLAGKQIYKGFNDLETWCKENNRLYLLDEWDYKKNKKLPSEVSIGSNEKVWWICCRGHNYSYSLYNRTNKYIMNLNNCPKCNREIHTSFPEQAIIYYLNKYYTDVLNGNKDLIGSEIDIYIPSEKIAIEYDGVTWHKGNEERDIQKNKKCIERNIKLIRIREEGLSELQDCICLFRRDLRTLLGLNIVIKELFSLLGKESVDIDVERDSTSIYNQYIFTVKSNSASEKSPFIEKIWDFQKNGGLLPSMVSDGSGKNVWFKCENGHSYKTEVRNVTQRGYTCPHCRDMYK